MVTETAVDRPQLRADIAGRARFAPCCLRVLGGGVPPAAHAAHAAGEPPVVGGPLSSDADEAGVGGQGMRGPCRHAVHLRPGHVILMLCSLCLALLEGSQMAPAACAGGKPGVGAVAAAGSVRPAGRPDSVATPGGARLRTEAAESSATGALHSRFLPKPGSPAASVVHTSRRLLYLALLLIWHLWFARLASMT